MGYSGSIASSRSVTASSEPPESIARPLAAKEIKNRDMQKGGMVFDGQEIAQRMVLRELFGTREDPV
jgi:hypothetical protein